MLEEIESPIYISASEIDSYSCVHTASNTDVSAIEKAMAGILLNQALLGLTSLLLSRLTPLQIYVLQFQNNAKECVLGTYLL